MNKKMSVSLTRKEKSELKKALENKYSEILDLMQQFNNKIAPDQHIKETPKRISKMFVDELLSGCFSDPPNMKKFKNDKSSNNPVIVDNITIKSLCSHHFVPFRGHAVIYYIPDKYLSGLSKFPRICEYYSRRPQIQEELTQQICDHIYNELKPKFVAVVMSAQHLCMLHRGINEYNSNCITIAYKIKNKKLLKDISVENITNLLLDRLNK